MSRNYSCLQMKSCHSFPIPISKQNLFPNSQRGPEFPAKVVSPRLALTDTEVDASGTVLIVIWDHLHHRMSSVICNWNSLVQNIRNLGKRRNYFKFSGIICCLFSLPHANFKHGNSSCRALYSSTAAHTVPSVVAHKFLWRLALQLVKELKLKLLAWNSGHGF